MSQVAILCHHVIQIQTHPCQMLYLHDKNSLLRSLNSHPFFSRFKNQISNSNHLDFGVECGDNKGTHQVVYQKGRIQCY
ncbi:hypothetical protein Peur_072857 [Populus x canadensis]